MKKNYFLAMAFFTAFCIETNAQISIVSTDLINVGENVPRAKDTVPSFTAGLAGPNRIWDFSNAIPDVLETTYAVAPSATPNGSGFTSNSNIAFSLDNISYIYANKTTNSLIATGGSLQGVDGTFITSQLNPTQTLYQFPVNYLNNFTDNNGFVATTSGASVGQPTINSIRITYTATTHDTVDAHGLVKLPQGIAECLRIKKRTISSTSIEFRLLPPPFGVYSPDPDSPYLNDDIVYYWVSKEGKVPVAEMSFDAATGNTTQLIYTLTPPDYCAYATVAPSNVQASNITQTSMDLSWTSGNGVGAVVFAKKGSAISFNPSDSVNYVADNNFGAVGTAYGDAFVVYNGTGNSFTLNNLDPAENYYFKVYEYSCNDIYYKTASANLVAGTLGAPSINYARLQIIHNSADLAASPVDIWIDNIKQFSGVSFRTATPFFDIIADTDFDVTIKASPSTDTLNGAFRVNNAMLDSGITYIAVANGILSTAGFAPAPAFDITAFPNAKETHSVSNETSVLLHHGVTDAPAVDVYSAGNPTPISSNLNYEDFDGYLNLPTSSYVLRITAAGDTNTVARFSAKLDSLNLGGQAITVLASGFLNPANNSNGAAFGLWAALASGGNLIELKKLPTVIDSIPDSYNAIMFENIKMFPNPVKNTLFIDLNDVSFDKNTSVQIYNMIGEKVFERTAIQNQIQTLDIQNLANGVYIVEIRNNDTLIGRSKIIKE
jgi:hypothetical protein